jgi:hypothetical protein
VRATAITLCSIGALLLLLGTLTSSWFKVPASEAGVSPGREHPVSFSLRSVEVCEPDGGWAGIFDACRTVSYEDIGAADGESVAVMKLTFVLGLLAVLWLVASLVLISVSSRAERGFAMAGATLCCACFLAAIGVNVIRPRLLVELDVAVGSSFWLYVLGTIFGAAGGIAGIRIRRTPVPVDLPGDPRAHFPPELSDPPAPGAPRTAIPSPVPLPSPPVEPRPCHRCGNAARWVPGYRRHWCDACTNWL